MRTMSILASLILMAIVFSCGSGQTVAPPGDTGAKSDGSGGDVPDTSGGKKDVVKLTDFGLSDFAGKEVQPLQCDEFPVGFGCPCQANEECASGFCVEGAEGFFCTAQCFEDCPDGWTCKGISGFGSDIIFLCVPKSKKLCFPCKNDNQCGGGKCVSMGEDDYCAIYCDGDEECPGGFACTGEGREGSEGLCLPHSGTCDCLVDNGGELRPCQKENEIGLCYGYEECDPEKGWGNCSAAAPSEEECNGLDDDCDVAIDEGLDYGGPCEVTNNYGTCLGTPTCLGPLGWACQAPEPAEEVCDYADNDCDGLVDEDFTQDGKYTAQEHCGTCAMNCELGFPNAQAICDITPAVPLCIVDQCSAGFVKLNDFQCIPNSAALCEPCTTDDNCLFVGAKCIQLVDGTFCSKECEINDDCPSGYLCKPYEDSKQCIPDTDSCTCTGDNLDLSKSCSKTYPDQPEPGEPSITCYGFQFCLVSGWGACTLPDETCDTVDNDCNGVADDPYVDAQGRYVTDSNCGQCSNNCTALNAPNANGVCNTDKAIPDCQIECVIDYFDVNSNPGDGCECHYESSTDHPGGLDKNCDGVDGEINNAVFVAKNGSDNGTGSIDAPMLTIGAAIDEAVDTGKRDVYVATGVYTESISLTPGVNLYGGYSSDFHIRHVLLYETVIMGDAPTQWNPGTVTMSNIQESVTTLDGFTIFGYDTSVPGDSSYTLYIRDSNEHLVVRNNHIYAGDAGPGGFGLNGTDGFDGVDGNPGSNAYLHNSTLCNQGGAVKGGGSAGTKACGGIDVSGGKGGDSYCPQNNADPKTAELGLPGSGPGAGQGGSAGWDAAFLQECALCNVPGDLPMDGSDGSHGSDGEIGGAGQGCQSPAGSVLGGLWQPGDGTLGQPGSDGGGGGGGGAGAGVTNLLNCTVQIGGTGGGGASGACAGTGGEAGGGGGASFGVFLYYSLPGLGVPQVDSNFIQGSNGGAGGFGGSGGTGGVGGAGGAGGTGTIPAWCARQGGSGGHGGIGGHGGGGGGGCGGMSAAIYVHGAGGLNLQPLKAGNQLLPGNGGNGGPGGPSIGNPGGAGLNGTAAATNF